MCAKRSLGQHFLVSPRVADEIVAACRALAPGASALLEIGPGHGALTEGLLALGLPLARVEKDDALAAELGRRFPGVRVANADARALDLASLGTESEPGRWLVAGNLPYNAGTEIVRGFLGMAHRCVGLVFMLQLEVARKLTASPREEGYGALAVPARAWWLPELLFPVPPGAFRPPPKVTSAVIRLRPLPTPLLEPGEFLSFSGFVRDCFAAPRKTLASNLARAAGGRAEAAALLERLDFPPAARPAETPPEAYVALFRALTGR